MIGFIFGRYLRGLTFLTCESFIKKIILWTFRSMRSIKGKISKNEKSSFFLQAHCNSWKSCSDLISKWCAHLAIWPRGQIYLEGEFCQSSCSSWPPSAVRGTEVKANGTAGETREEGGTKLPNDHFQNVQSPYGFWSWNWNCYLPSFKWSLGKVVHILFKQLDHKWIQGHLAPRRKGEESRQEKSSGQWPST